MACACNDPVVISALFALGAVLGALIGTFSFWFFSRKDILDYTNLVKACSGGAERADEVAARMEQACERWVETARVVSSNHCAVIRSALVAIRRADMRDACGRSCPGAQTTALDILNECPEGTRPQIARAIRRLGLHVQAEGL